MKVVGGKLSRSQTELVALKTQEKELKASSSPQLSSAFALSFIIKNCGMRCWDSGKEEFETPPPSPPPPPCMPMLAKYHMDWGLGPMLRTRWVIFWWVFIDVCLALHLRISSQTVSRYRTKVVEARGMAGGKGEGRGGLGGGG